MFPMWTMLAFLILIAVIAMLTDNYRIGFVVIGLAIFVVVMLGFYSFPQEEVTSIVQREDIYSVNVDKTIDGRFNNSFIIGFGYIDTDLVYYCYTQDIYGKVLKDYDAKSTYIETIPDGEQAYAVTYYEDLAMNTPNFLIGGLFKAEPYVMRTRVRSVLYLNESFTEKSISFDNSSLLP